ncbi:DUF3368 domain-containing protein [Fimbriimonas ginsengisoli]|uniref:Nucleic acid-binding protein n=1 Tax=Fimbriimonas ginsengisoli Gsoil 348 TaxID=661478 RepID=A0A068NNI6_FIMGI|nr:DUF3368 domain-containing protein [Fimbriimonas ginsengisoli]AIE85108.1 hypothetical protein OP10G_1740 [Fimbriimonas ginsengisoli Gsoil 348]
MIVVADNGPLLHLDEIEQFSLLTCFEKVWVPVLVAKECELYQVNLGRHVGLIEIDPNKYPVPWQLEPYLAADVIHPAEAQAISLALSSRIEHLLTDDAAAREAAKSVGVTPVGSLGVVLRAFEKGLIARNRAGELLDAFQSSSLYLKPEVLRRAHELLSQLGGEGEDV